MKKVLAFGGAFNPPTKAHVALADFAWKKTGFDGVIFIPSKQSYIKYTEGKDFAFADEDRLAMLTKIAADKPWMKVCSFELTFKEQPRTYFTLKHLSAQGFAPSLLLGSDWLTKLRTDWSYVEEIASQFGIYCLARSKDDPEAIIQNDDYLKKLASFIHVLRTPVIYQDVSSTAARAQFRKALKKEQNSLREMIPDELDGLSSFIEKYREYL